MTSPFQVDRTIQALLLASEEESWIKVDFNGVEMFLPVGTILTMAHCMSVSDDGRVVLNVETAHLDWMRRRLHPGAVFLDVGSATGAMTLPIAKQFPGVQIVAFEPADRARRLLVASLIRNDLLGVRIVPAAISDRDGEITFVNRPVSADGAVPFLPETSSIVGADYVDPHGGEVVTLSTLTLDSVGQKFGLVRRDIVIKIDIEGYEIEALQGAGSLLADNRVSLAIDIHTIPEGTPNYSPNTNAMTDLKCKEILKSFGYNQFNNLGHVLLCER